MHYPRSVPDMEIIFFSQIYLFLASLQRVIALRERDPRSHPKYPPVFWKPGFPMFSNRTNPARIVVQMHDSIDFFCPDYIHSQYQSFSGGTKKPSSSSDYGAEEIYMVNGQDYYQTCFNGPDKGRMPKKHTRLLLRCPGKNADSRVKAKYQYTVSFRMFSPVPKGPEFNCNEEYLFLGIFHGHSHEEESVEKALCSNNALRLQIFVSCAETPTHRLFDLNSPLNVIQLDRPDTAAEVTSSTTTSAAPSDFPTTAPNVRPPVSQDHFVEITRSLKGTRTTKGPGLLVAKSDRKIMRNESRNSSRRSTPKPLTSDSRKHLADLEEPFHQTVHSADEYSVEKSKAASKPHSGSKHLKYYGQNGMNDGGRVICAHLYVYLFVVFSLHLSVVRLRGV